MAEENLSRKGFLLSAGVVLAGLFGVGKRARAFPEKREKTVTPAGRVQPAPRAVPCSQPRYTSANLEE
jgi:hypothetical protein